MIVIETIKDINANRTLLEAHTQSKGKMVKKKKSNILPNGHLFSPKYSILVSFFL